MWQCGSRALAGVNLQAITRMVRRAASRFCGDGKAGRGVVRGIPFSHIILMASGGNNHTNTKCPCVIEYPQDPFSGKPVHYLGIGLNSRLDGDGMRVHGGRPKVSHRGFVLRSAPTRGLARRPTPACWNNNRTKSTPALLPRPLPSVAAKPCVCGGHERVDGLDHAAREAAAQ